MATQDVLSTSVSALSLALSENASSLGSPPESLYLDLPLEDFPPIESESKQPLELHRGEFNVQPQYPKHERRFAGDFLRLVQLEPKITEEQCEQARMGGPPLDRFYEVSTKIFQEMEANKRLNIPRDRPSTKGQLEAQKINWQRTLYDGERLSAAAHRLFVENVDQGDAPAFCRVCQKYHIFWGPPITLADRDTCGSMLPDWFPKEKFQRPWSAFRETMNDLVRDQEYQENDESMREATSFFHPASDRWTDSRRLGGWWHCRLDGADVPEMEKKCSMCHSVQREESKTEETNSSWINRATQLVADQDKKEVLRRFKQRRSSIC